MLASSLFRIVFSTSARGCFAAGVLCLLAMGCRRELSRSEPAKLSEIPPILEKAFKTAGAGPKQEASEIAAAVHGGDPVKAFLQLQELNAKPELTAEQRTAAARAFVAVLQQLNAAARAGNSDASKLLDAYHRSK